MLHFATRSLLVLLRAGYMRVLLRIRDVAVLRAFFYTGSAPVRRGYEKRRCVGCIHRTLREEKGVQRPSRHFVRRVNVLRWSVRQNVTWVDTPQLRLRLCRTKRHPIQCFVTWIVDEVECLLC